jgi:glycosyltransferase involved in cell wall biosynthesis
VTLSVDVVVPARDEQDLIGACLRAVFGRDDRLDVRVVVVANGCTDRTVDVVRGLQRQARAAGHDLRLVEIPAAGKWRALNAAAAHTRGCAVIYLDADTVLLPGTVHALATALAQDTSPRLAAPAPVLVPPRGRLARDFAAVWTRLPAVAGQVHGSGVYAVNPAGRARWSLFPPVTADDAFVRSRFGATEQSVIRTGGFLLLLPEGRELVAVVRRWRRGNRELADRTPSAGWKANLHWLLRHPSLWPHVPGFALVLALTRLTSPPDPHTWARAAHLRQRAGIGSRLR